MGKKLLFVCAPFKCGESLNYFVGFGYWMVRCYFLLLNIHYPTLGALTWIMDIEFIQWGKPRLLLYCSDPGLVLFIE
jgi:hypothetical protein